MPNNRRIQTRGFRPRKLSRCRSAIFKNIKQRSLNFFAWKIECLQITKQISILTFKLNKLIDTMSFRRWISCKNVRLHFQFIMTTFTKDLTKHSDFKTNKQTFKINLCWKLPNIFEKTFCFYRDKLVDIHFPVNSWILQLKYCHPLKSK